MIIYDYLTKQIEKKQVKKRNKKIWFFTVVAVLITLMLIVIVYTQLLVPREHLPSKELEEPKLTYYHAN